MASYIIPLLATAAALIRAATLPGRKLIWFIAHLIAGILSGIALWYASSISPHAYSAVWIWSEPIVLTLWFGMALEVYGRVAEFYPGMSRPAWAAAGLSIAMAITMFSIIEPHSNTLKTIFLYRRLTATVLPVAIVALAALFYFFRNSLPPNLVRHAAIMAAYFVTQGLSVFGANLTGKIVAWSKIDEWGATACYIAWALLLTAPGQARPHVARTKSNDELSAVEAKLDAVVDIASSAGRHNTRDSGHKVP